MNPQSPLSDDFKEAFTHYFRSDKRVHDEDKIFTKLSSKAH